MDPFLEPSHRLVVPLLDFLPYRVQIILCGPACFLKGKDRGAGRGCFEKSSAIHALLIAANGARYNIKLEASKAVRRK
jgi:hypothetical protein